MGRFSVAALWNPIRVASRVTPSRNAPVEIPVMGRGRRDVLNARHVRQTGIGLYVPHRFIGCDPHEEVELVITLPRERPFLARGIIKHRTDSESEGRHFGVHFTEISRVQRAKIRDYVREMSVR